MATKETKKKWEANALEIRGALPKPEHIATVLCEQGYGLHWDKTPPALKTILDKAASKSLSAISGLMAKEPKLLKQADEAKI